MKLYLVHCGFYDNDLCDGLYESHVNFFVVADGFKEARIKTKEHPDFKRKRMHIDGLQEVEAVCGFRITPTLDDSLAGKTLVHSHAHRDLAPSTPKASGPVT